MLTLVIKLTAFMMRLKNEFKYLRVKIILFLILINSVLIIIANVKKEDLFNKH